MIALPTLATLATACCSALLLSGGAAARRDVHGLPRPGTFPKPALPIVEPSAEWGPVVDRSGNTLPPYNTTYYFDQLIDHTNPKLGTFKQRYYFTSEYYQKGGPIILMTPGEANFARYYTYLTNVTINGQVAQAQSGATIVLEHRFFGLSNPYPDLTDESFKVHTLEQAVEDLAYFAQTAKLPMTDGDKVHAPKQAPWILMGGSYSGALTSWTMKAKPNVFWAGYSSSGVVEAIEYYWGYFEPIRQHMPKNCTADVIRVVSHMDQVFTKGSKSQIASLKAQFGMANVTHLDDVAGTLRNPIWNWQSLSPSSGGKVFFDFCDALEKKADGSVAGPNGWGLDYALVQFGKWMTDYVNSYCDGPVDDACLGSYDPSLSLYTDTKIDNDWRSWVWLCCSSFGYWQDGAPRNWPSLVTRLVDPYYDNRQCSYYFPKTYNKRVAKPATGYINSRYGGWDVNTPRLFFANGGKDPWREATVSSDFHNRGSGTEQTPIRVSPNGIHCSDLRTANGVVDAGVLATQKAGLAYLDKWVKQWKALYAGGKNVTASAVETRDATTILLEDRADAESIPADVASAQPEAVPAAIANAPTTKAPQRDNAKHMVASGWNFKPAH